MLKNLFCGFFIATLLVFFTNCESQNTPQPKLTVLSDPSSPIASPETEENTHNSSTNEANEANETKFSPQDTILAFCTADFKGVRTSPETYQQIIPYILWEEELTGDATIVSDFRIVNSAIVEDRANIAITYNNIGQIKKDEKGKLKIEKIGLTTETLNYKLVKDKGQWKIEAPQPPPHISLEVAKKIVNKNN
ncbi:MAG: hypothetical protein IPK14_17835 [Blastocatellia bacterium]|nr:hypothetical protein [Blastocatellia bacterium]MBL8193356.1 hypothetical protein [Blastocatellia bacterium]MBN8722592.1 hypothetical protein [Acidobacteriota bacterium]